MDGEHDAALCRSINLGDDEAGDGNRFRKSLSLGDRILSDGAVENEERLVRRAGKSFPDHSIDLFHLVHERSAGV